MSELSTGMNDKLNRLDNAFLFVISLVGLFFTIIQAYMHGIEGLVEISPLLFLGVVLPFYIGYIRGAIEFNSLVERIRGWVYLLMGIFTYFAFLLARFDFWIYLGLIIFGILCVYNVERWFKAIFGLSQELKNLSIIYGTLFSGVALTVFIRQITHVIHSVLFGFERFYVTLLFVYPHGYLAFLVFLRLELITRRVFSGNIAITTLMGNIEDMELLTPLFRLVFLSWAMVVSSNLPLNKRFYPCWLAGVILFPAGILLDMIFVSWGYTMALIPNAVFLISLTCLTIETIAIFRKIDYSLFQEVRKNAVHKYSKN